MGYFGNGFLLLREPAWGVFRALPPTLALAGYKHRTMPVWLLEIWKPARYQHWPFTDPISGHLPPLALSAEAESQLATFDEIADAIRQDESLAYGPVELRAAAVVSKLVAGRVFFFAADDETLDMAAHAEDGHLLDARLDLGTYLVTLNDGKIEVSPRVFDEDPERMYSEDVLARLRELPGVAVGPRIIVEGGDRFYGSAVALWPAEAGDPAKMLGIGTWDPFLNMEKDYVLVFSQGTPEAARKTSAKPWWKFW